MRKTERVCILVKAYPQPSQKYEETVCVAGITASGELLRLYPIPYRLLSRGQRFNRFDWVEMEIERATEDHRPESYKVNPDSIRIIKSASKLKPDERVRLWKPFVYGTLDELRKANEASGVSLGIVPPRTDDLKFVVREAKNDTEQDKAVSLNLFQQAQLFETDPLPEMETPEYSFEYHFWSGSSTSRMKIHDWEVAATYYNYKRRYGQNEAIEHMKKMYSEEMPMQNLHFIFGTMKRYPRQFIIIGVLRTKTDIEKATAQGQLL